ncbi:MAG: carboxypeptidase regulatory-like domain-containing protein [Bacteroidales bacterium]|nr:carboxypeptidase regulatory-like domain-containing protein [Bacteroidales bacterium]
MRVFFCNFIEQMVIFTKKEVLPNFWEQPHGERSSSQNFWERPHGERSSFQNFWEQPHGERSSSQNFWERPHGERSSSQNFWEQPPGERSSAKTSGFNIKSLPAGVYIVTIKKPGYADQVITVTVTDGEMCELNIQLTKS